MREWVRVRRKIWVRVRVRSQINKLSLGVGAKLVVEVGFRVRVRAGKVRETYFHFFAF